MRRRHYGIARPTALLAVITGLLLAAMAAAAEEELPILARVGAWPVASELIGFRGRLWLVNSVKGVNHNSADLYSYNPETAELRYERHRFSQVLRRIVAMAARSPRWGRQEPLPLIEADRLEVTAALLCQLATPHGLLPDP